MIGFYTYDQIANIFRVKKSTVKFWKSQGKLSLYGYRPYKDQDGHRRTEAIFEESEVKRLCEAIFKRGSWYMQNIDKRLKDKAVSKAVNKVVDEVGSLNSMMVQNRSSLGDNSHVEGDEIIVNHDDNDPDKTDNE